MSRDLYLNWLSCGVALLALCLLLIFRVDLSTMPIQRLSRVALIVSVVLCAIVIGRAPRGLWSSTSLFVFVYALFHFGLLYALAFGIEAPREYDYRDVSSGLDRWFYRPETKIAAWLTLLGLASFVNGTFVANIFPAKHKGIVSGSPSDELSKRDSHLLAHGAAVLAITGIVGWVVCAILAGGTSIFFSSYQNYLSRTEDYPLATFHAFIKVGIVILSATRWTRIHRITLGAFALFALLALPMGLRSEVLFPIVAAACVYAARHRLPRTLPTLLLVVVLLAGIAGLRQLRTVGVRDYAASQVALSFNPLAGLVEMGSSLRPVVETVRWQRAGEARLHGRTYWAPFDRALVYIIPGWQRPPAERDNRIMNIVVMRRVGPIGFSVVAEANHNFGAWGVFAIMFIIGFALARMDRWSSSFVRQAMLGIVFGALLLHIRNSFVAVPFQVLFGSSIVAVAMLRARLSFRTR